jgi:hypothetical protein
MEDEWTTVISGDQLVKFTYLDLPEGRAFLTAQIAGHDVVYSVIVQQAQHPFHREGVERHFDCQFPPTGSFEQRAGKSAGKAPKFRAGRG